MKHSRAPQDLMIGTSLMGYVLATRDELEATFGEPYEYGAGDKVTTEWVLHFEDLTIATIYDWKRYEQGAPYPDENYDWHIGGDSALAVTRVLEAVLENKN